MHRAHKFITEAREEALKLMEKNIRELHPKELDLIVALCDAHNEVCEMVELSEKIDYKSHDDKMGSLFGGNLRRR